MNIEWTDRYGGNYPNPATMCNGDCDGMGCYPHSINDPSSTDHERAEIARIQADLGVEHDGWYFVRCPTCNGTGKMGGAA
jgi:hypothetical protein